jgi:small GTP-binding protein
VAKINWLHLSDLQIGASGSGWLQAEVREEFERDLRKLHERSGPWHLVLISGDLTQTGGEREFALLASALESFWRFLEGLGSSPVLLAVPGNHDFVWGSQSAAVRELLQTWRNTPVLPEQLWPSAPDPLRQFWQRGFSNYVKWAARWREAHPSPRGLSIREGLVPGDFSARLEVDGAQIAIAGLNSALFDLDGSSSLGVIAGDVTLLKGTFEPEKAAAAGSRNDVTLLLTHHPLHWFRADMQARIADFGVHEGAPLLHLCGSVGTRFDPVQSYRSLTALQAPSLFADAKRHGKHYGYNAASLELGEKGGRLRVWSRLATRLSVGDATWLLAAHPALEATKSLEATKLLTLLEASTSALNVGEMLEDEESVVMPLSPPDAAFDGPPPASGAAEPPPAPGANEPPLAPGVAAKGVPALPSVGAPAPMPAPPVPTLAPPVPMPAPPARSFDGAKPPGEPSPKGVGPPLSAPRGGVGVRSAPAREGLRGTLGRPAPPALALESFAGPAPGGEAGAAPSTGAPLANVVGVSARSPLEITHSQVNRVAWSPDGGRLAVGTRSGHVEVYDVASRQRAWGVARHSDEIVDLAWSSDGKTLASSSKLQLNLWGGPQGKLSSLALFGVVGSCIAWSPDDAQLARGDSDGGVSILHAPAWVESAPMLGLGVACCLAWSRADAVLASGWDKAPWLWLHQAMGDPPRWQTKGPLDGHHGAVLALDVRPNSTQFASASVDRTVRIWDTTGKAVAALEGHSAMVTGVSFSFDGRLLASTGHDATVRLWRTDTWEQVAVIAESGSRRQYSALAFSPTAPVLATCGPSGRSVRFWDIDIDALLRSAPRSATVHAVSAKVVLVGEGNAGKSCLALRLAEDRYEELAATHGMRFWPLPLERLDPGAEAPAGERREVVLWDMGGQSEYRLIHQLFLRDTAVALMLLEPRRGKAAVDEIEGWDKRFQAQASGPKPVQRLLVGTKVDDEACPVDRPALDDLVRRLGFKAYLSTSARSTKGIDELRRALSSAIDWAELGRTSRPELFERLRHEIGRLREARRVVVMFDQLEQAMRASDPERFDPEALRAVVKQLATQGVLADTRLADGTRALVLEVEQVERYAGSLIVLARQNPRGVPAIDLSTLIAPAAAFPRILPEERLRRDQELVVLDCVIELLLEHGVCFRHEGLLVFPSLFRPSGAGDDAPLPHAISLYYDFSGAIDNIYASLVASLAMSRRFGHPRLWEDRAEFSLGAKGVSGVRKVERKGGAARGVAHLDVYFDEHASAEARALFVGFIEDHLGAHGVEILEHLQMTCPCGETFSERAVRRRIAEGQADIGCQVCDRRAPLTLGAREAKERSPDLAQKLRALRSTVKEGKVESVAEAKVSLDDARKGAEMNEPIRILHLSDLHIGGDADVAALLQPLGADLRDPEEGLGTERLDYLIVSGDISNRASPEEFERAREFISTLIREFGLTAERCIIVPGNHDLSWDEEVYAWKKRRQVDPSKLAPGTFVPKGPDDYLVRDDARYPERFRNFSRHFYHPVLQQEYPLAAEQQCIPFLAPADGLQFLAMNSAFEIDEYFPARSGVDARALSRGLDEAERQVRRAREEGRLAAGAKVLKLAVWHHPVSGNEKIEHDAFLGRLQQAGVRACLHGHVHEDRADLLKYVNGGRAIHAVGAGSFGAPARERPESVPRLYNLVEVERDRSRLRVHTRCLKKGGGAWEGWAVWPGAGKGQKRTYYEIELA